MRLKQLVSGAVLLLGAVCAQAAPDQATLLRDMAKLDRSYIPVLALTSDENDQPALRAMVRLRTTWAEFHNTYAAAMPEDAQWKKDFDAVDGHIRRAAEIVARRSGLKDAHGELEHVREIFMHLRERHQMEYFIDHLTRFHEPMEAIVLAVKDRTPDNISAEDLETVRKQLPLAVELWGRARGAPFDSALFGFSSEQWALRVQLIEAEAKALKGLEQALATGDKAAVIASGVAIKPAFARLFRLFGEFPVMGDAGAE